MDNWGGGLSPAAALQSYWYQKYKEVLTVKNANVTVLEQPKNGIVIDGRRDKIGELGPTFIYSPNHGFIGQDKITFLVEAGGKSVKVVTTLIVVKVAGLHGSPCFSDIKRISSNETPNLANGLASGLTTDQLAGILSDAAGVTVTISDLPGGAVGQTVGSTITLDTNASGYNWFIDPTPADNSEFLPTSNPNEWVAKAGSDAAGKMDMLSVLLHEYGHALGIEHSADANDYMGATLTAGVRRLPSAEEMALRLAQDRLMMQGLVAQAKVSLTRAYVVGASAPYNYGLPLAGATLSQGERGQDVPLPFPTIPLGGMSLAFVGLLRSNRYGGLSIAPDGSSLVTQYDWAANPAFANLDYAGGWSTLGGVEITPATTSTDPSTGQVLDFNLATVSLTVTPVSDGRVAQVMAIAQKADVGNFRS